MSKQQLTLEQRYEIKAYMQAGFGFLEIAFRIGVHRSTVYREVKRNSGLRGYRPEQAQQKALARRRQAPKHIRFDRNLQQQVEEWLQLDWSPEQISGYLAQTHHTAISHETIYQHIWADKKAGGTLYQHLRCSSKKKRKRYGGRDRRGQIPGRVSIDNRPLVVNAKERLGDWEVDTIIGKNHRGALVTAVERKTKFTCIQLVHRKTADAVARALITMLMPFQKQILTITVDNGKEFAHHQQIADALNTNVFFAHPYHAWERGLNENTNGLLRQYFPKKSSFETITNDQIKFAQNRLNARPRKRLLFKTPRQAFQQLTVALET